MKKLVLLGVISAMLLAIPLVASAGVSGPAFYVDGTAYRTVGTPTDFSNTGAPDHSFDTIYAFDKADQMMNVATAAPGDRGLQRRPLDGRGGHITPLRPTTTATRRSVDDFDEGSGDFDSAAEVHAAIDAGAITTTAGPSFECPVIPLPRGRH